MASKTLLRNIGGVDDVRIVLTNSTLVRALSIGTSWSTLRVSIRYSMTDYADTLSSTPDIAIGVCSGSSLPYNNGSALTTHFVGWRNATGTFWTRTAGPPPYYTPGSYNLKACKRVGTTFTYTAGTNNMVYTTAFVANPIYRQVLGVQITKGSPNYTINYYGRNDGLLVADVSQSTFLNQMVLASPSIAYHGFGLANTVAVNEGTDGALDHVNIAWDRVLPAIEISDILVTRLS